VKNKRPEIHSADNSTSWHGALPRIRRARKSARLKRDGVGADRGFIVATLG
jgi:hypothetical protein